MPGPYRPRIRRHACMRVQIAVSRSPVTVDASHAGCGRAQRWPASSHRSATPPIGESAVSEPRSPARRQRTDPRNGCSTGSESVLGGIEIAAEKIAEGARRSHRPSRPADRADSDGTPVDVAATCAGFTVTNVIARSHRARAAFRPGDHVTSRAGAADGHRLNDNVFGTRRRSTKTSGST